MLFLCILVIALKILLHIIRGSNWNCSTSHLTIYDTLYKYTAVLQSILLLLKQKQFCGRWGWCILILILCSCCFTVLFCICIIKWFYSFVNFSCLCRHLYVWIIYHCDVRFILLTQKLTSVKLLYFLQLKCKDCVNNKVDTWWWKCHKTRYCTFFVSPWSHDKKCIISNYSACGHMVLVSSLVSVRRGIESFITWKVHMLVDGELGPCSLTFRERIDAVKCIYWNH